MFNKSNEITTAIIAVTIVFLLLSGAIILFFLWYERKKKINREKIQEMKLKSAQMEAQYQQEILRTQLEIQEQTLKTISQEIHDNIGQVLSLAKLNLNTMDIDQREQLQEKINDSKNLVSKAILDLRDLSKSFNTDNIAAMGLLRAVEYQLEMIRKTGYETILEVKGDIIKMEPQRELIIFRIIQETLNNTIKHAAAKKITVDARYASTQLELTIQDNGQGVDLNLVNQQAGLGIRNMHNRAKMIHADFSMSSTINEGTTVKLIIPITK